MQGAVEVFQQWLSNPYIPSMLAGVAAAAVVDVAAFKSWKSYNDAAAYDWTTTSWRWLQGAGTGLLAALGIAGLT